MGKKVKKDDKGPADDVFDPLLVESRQAQTVVLMLNSDEDDVLAKACEAIYKFVDKCDENRVALLDLGAIDALLRLIEHEDKVVRRNACMCLGVMASQVDCRKALKKRAETIPGMIQLLSPEEDSVVHEFAALCLVSLANDYSSKVAIYEQNGLEPLIRCLHSQDPDVQKNAIEAIASLLQDYQTKAGLRELGGLEPLLQLLESEYAIIQKLALDALCRATEDTVNRAVLRELDGLDRLINFIGHPEWSDLHVFAVMVLANCLEDPQNMEAIKENHGLARLVAFITDTASTEEEEVVKKGKGDKDKKAAPSRTGKRGKGDDGKRRKTPIPEHDDEYMAYSYYQEERRKGGESDGRVTFPEVKEHAARAIARAAKNPENRKLLHEQEVERALITLLALDDAHVQMAAAHALGVLAENLVCRDAIGTWDGIEPLVVMLKNEDPAVREAASMALANLTTSNMTNCHKLSKEKGVESLIDMLADSKELAIANASVILTNMSCDEGLRSEIQSEGVAAALIEPLGSSNTAVQTNAAQAIAAFAIDQSCRSSFREAGGVERVVALLESSSDDVRRAASWAMSVLAADPASSLEVCKHGGLEKLQEINLSTIRKNPFSDIALGKLLDNNLSAKYALKGHLSCNNHITDGFIDVGKLPPDAELKSLEEYCNQDVNQRRPILLINAKAEKPSVSHSIASDSDVGDRASRTSVGGRVSRTGRESKGKRAQREREERQREEELQQLRDAEAAAAAPEAWSEPVDPALLAAVQHVQELIQPLPTSRDQVVALAQYVAERMGGPIEKGQLSNFSWELPISQIKFELKSNVIPIGMITRGIHYHRALLFKALADRIAVGCTLVRGDYNRAWNVVMLTEESVRPGAPRFPPKPHIVDLIHHPGRLMDAESPEAVSYQRL